MKCKSFGAKNNFASFGTQKRDNKVVISLSFPQQ